MLNRLLSDTDKTPDYKEGYNETWMRIGECDCKVSVKLEISREDNPSKEPSKNN